MAKAEKLEPILQTLFDLEFRFDNATDQYQIWANQRLDEFEAAPFKDKKRLERLWRSALTRAVYKGMDAKSVPIEDLRIMASLSGDGSKFEQQYADKIRSPLSAIRANCIQDVGDLVGVRNCTTINCPLFPFRMGMNPFYGRIADADVEATEDMEIPEEQPQQDEPELWQSLEEASDPPRQQEPTKPRSTTKSKKRNSKS